VYIPPFDKIRGAFQSPDFFILSSDNQGAFSKLDRKSRWKYWWQVLDIAEDISIQIASLFRGKDIQFTFMYAKIFAEDS